MAVQPRYHHGDLRAALVERATDVVATSGVDELSLRELARDLGVSHAAPSRHFTDRQALLNAVAVEGFNRLGAALETSSPADPSTPFADSLRAHAKSYVRFAVTNPSLLTVMFAAKHRREPPPEIVRAAERAFAVPFRLIAEAQERGEVVAGPIDDIGTAIYATMHGFATLMAGGLLDQPDWPRSLSQTMELLVQGLRPRSPGEPPTPRLP